MYFENPSLQRQFHYGCADHFITDEVLSWLNENGYSQEYQTIKSSNYDEYVRARLLLFILPTDVFIKLESNVVCRLIVHQI